MEEGGLRGRRRDGRGRVDGKRRDGSRKKRRVVVGK